MFLNHIGEVDRQMRRYMYIYIYIYIYRLEDSCQIGRQEDRCKIDR